MWRCMGYNRLKREKKAMKKIASGDIVVIKEGRNIEIPEIGSCGSPTIMFRKGAIGKVIGWTYNSSDNSDYITVEFNLFYGISIRINISPNDVENASSEQVARYDSYNCQ